MLLVADFIYSAALTDRPERQHIKTVYFLPYFSSKKKSEKGKHTSIPSILPNIRLFLAYGRATMHQLR